MSKRTIIDMGANLHSAEPLELLPVRSEGFREFNKLAEQLKREADEKHQRWLQNLLTSTTP